MVQEFFYKRKKIKTGYATFRDRRLPEKGHLHHQPVEHNWREGLSRLVETVTVPDFDTGFMFIKVNKTYDLKHDFDTMPTQTAMWLTDVQEPKRDVDRIIVIPSLIWYSGSNDFRGVELRHVSLKKMEVETATDFLKTGGAWTEAYLRILLWR